MANVLRNRLIRILRKMKYFLWALSDDIGIRDTLVNLWLIAALRSGIMIKMR